MPQGGLVAPWVDAQRGEVFAALYESGGDACRSAPDGAAAGADTAGPRRDRRAGRRVRFVGDGAVRYAETIDAALGPRRRSIASRAAAGRIDRPDRGGRPQRAVAPHAVVPIYVRRPDAELARERRRREV